MKNKHSFSIHSHPNPQPKNSAFLLFSFTRLVSYGLWAFLGHFGVLHSEQIARWEVCVYVRCV